MGLRSSILLDREGSGFLGIVNQVILFGRLCSQVDYTPQDWLGGNCDRHAKTLFIEATQQWLFWVGWLFIVDLP